MPFKIPQPVHLPPGEYTFNCFLYDRGGVAHNGGLPQFGGALCARPFLLTAVAHLGESLRAGRAGGNGG
jgi:hypothetical protein